MNDTLLPELDEDTEQILENYQIDKLTNVYNDVYSDLNELEGDVRIGTAAAITLRLASFPLTLTEVSMDFDIPQDKLEDHISTYLEENDIDKEIDTEYFKEKRMLVLQNLTQTNEWKRGYNTLIDDVYKAELQEENDSWSDNTVLLTIAWQASKMSAYDADTLYKEQLGNMFESVDESDIENCYIDLFIDNGYNVHPQLHDEHGYLKHIDENLDTINARIEEHVGEEYRIDEDLLKSLYTKFEEYEVVDADNEYSNKTVAMIIVSELFDVPMDVLDIGTDVAKMERIAEKIDTDVVEM